MAQPGFALRLVDGEHHDAGVRHRRAGLGVGHENSVLGRASAWVEVHRRYHDVMGADVTHFLSRRVLRPSRRRQKESGDESRQQGQHQQGGAVRRNRSGDEGNG